MLKISLSLLFFVILLQGGDVPQFNLPIILSIALGFSVRLGLNWNNNTITFKNSAIRLIFAVSICYMVMFAWKDYELQYNIVYTMWIVSLMSMEIVNEITKLLVLGFKAYGKKWINYLMANDERV